MRKIINLPENYTDDMLRGIYAAYPESVTYADDLRSYCRKNPVPGKVAIITGGGTGHLPLFLGYVGDGLIDGCGVGSVFQSPTPEQIVHIVRHVDGGKGVLFLYGNYTGDIMTFDMAAEICDMEGIETASVVGADDVSSGEPSVRRGVAGIFYLYKAAGAVADAGKDLQEVAAAAKKMGERVRTVGFSLSPCILPEVGKPGFQLEEGEMAMGMGIHGEPGIWEGPIRTAKEIAKESLEVLFKDMPIPAGEEVSVLINGLGATPLDELYILYAEVQKQLKERGIGVFRPYIGNYATSMEMAGASISICHVNEEIKEWLNHPVHTPFFTF